MDERHPEQIASPTEATHLSLPERLIVAPASGRFSQEPPATATPAAQGERISRGQELASIDNGSERIPVRSPFDGWLLGSLISEREPVKQGQALFRVRI